MSDSGFNRTAAAERDRADERDLCGLENQNNGVTLVDWCSFKSGAYLPIAAKTRRKCQESEFVN